MKFFVCLFSLFILAVAMARPAAAATTANFQADCDSGIPTDCVFDPTRTPSGQTATSCAPSTVKKYFWDFGDGTNSGFITPPPTQTSHTYSSSETDIDVCLTVFCNNNTSATTCHCFSNVFGVGGCIRPGAGWTP